MWIALLLLVPVGILCKNSILKIATFDLKLPLKKNPNIVLEYSCSILTTDIIVKGKRSWFNDDSVVKVVSIKRNNINGTFEVTSKKKLSMMLDHLRINNIAMVL